jgi:hypothetical protein
MDNSNPPDCFERPNNYNNKWSINTEGNPKCYKYINSNTYNMPILIVVILKIIYFNNK